MGTSIAKVEGIGDSYAEKLKKAGVATTDGYLERAKDGKGRKALAAETGIDQDRILKWANLCDLMRIKGVGEEYSELLEAAGVDTVKELRRRNSASLAKAVLDANEKKKLCRVVPSEKVVAGWIEHAKTLPVVLEY